MKVLLKNLRQRNSSNIIKRKPLNTTNNKKKEIMKETLIDVETGEVLNVNIEGIYKLTPGQHKRINDNWRKTVIKTFSNREKKRYLIKRKLR